jgi:TonB family protein
MRLVMVLVVLAAPLLAQEAKEEAKIPVNAGVQAFRQGRYPEAIAAFRQAADLDPNYATAHLYLGSTYMALWIPGAQSAENIQNANSAEAEFQKVLELDPADLTALASLASLSFTEAGALPPAQQPAKLDAARDFNQRIVQLDPMNRDAFYMLGVIAWRKWYPAQMTARLELGMTPEAPGPLRDASVRQSLTSTYGPVIEEGISNLEAALRIDPTYDDAMAYMNLLIRERADLRDTQEEYTQDVAAADLWLQRALEIKKAKASPEGARAPIKFSGSIQEQRLISKVEPEYPPLAQQAQVQGEVRFVVTIGKDGRVAKVQILSGHPLLVPAALAAVQQWVYRPTLLNSEPVEVQTDVSINFTLSAP